MGYHLHGNIITHYGIAANNRGETEGNITTLQKLLWKNEIHTTVSAEAIRFAIRFHWQQQFHAGNSELETNRKYDYSNDKRFLVTDFIDVNHLNFIGATKFSNIINKEIIEPLEQKRKYDENSKISN